MSELKSVLIVCLHAFPDTAVGARRPSELANHLARRGWSVTVAAAEWTHPDKGGELDPRICRLSVRIPRKIYPLLQSWIPRSWRSSGEGWPNAKAEANTEQHKPDDARPSLYRSSIRRARTFYLALSDLIDCWKLFSLRLFLALLRDVARQRPDVVIASGPYWSPVVAAGLVARLLRRPFIADFRDPWIDRAEEQLAVSPGHWPIRIALVAERITLHRAAAVTTTTWRLARLLEARYPFLQGRISVLPNGFDPLDVINTPPPTGELRFLFAGTLYLNRNPFPFLKGLSNFLSQTNADPSKVRVVLAGCCSHVGHVDLKEWIHLNELASVVELRGPVPVEEVRRLTAASNILLNFAQNQPDCVPAKLYEQLAAFRTILLFAEADSEVAEVASRSPAVIRLDDDVEEVQRTLTNLYSQYVESSEFTNLTSADCAAFSRADSIHKFESLATSLMR